MTFTSDEVRAKVAAMLPNTAVLDRGRYSDGVDIEDGVKERVARALYSRVEAPFSLASVVADALSEDMTALIASVASVDRCLPAMRRPDTTATLDVTYFRYQTELALQAAPEALARLVEPLSAQMVASARAGGLPAFGEAQAASLLEESLAQVTKALASLQPRVAALRGLLTNLAAADLPQWILRRQVRATNRTLQEMPETGSDSALALLLSSSLLRSAQVTVDWTAPKYSGTVTTTVHANRFTLTDGAPSAPYSILPGDVLYTNDPYDIDVGVVNSVRGNSLYLTNTPAVTTGTAYVASGAYLSYVTMVKALVAAQPLLDEQNTYVEDARQVGYGRTGYATYSASRGALLAAAQAVLDATSAYTVPQVPEVRALLEALREERLMGVLRNLQALDFVAVSTGALSQFSVANSIFDLVDSLSASLGANEPVVSMKDSDPLVDTYARR